MELVCRERDRQPWHLSVRGDFDEPQPHLDWSGSGLKALEAFAARDLAGKLWKGAAAALMI
jgi:hypothetical protein